MNKRMPYSVYKQFFPRHKAEGYDQKKKSILVFDVPDQQDLFVGDDVQKESKYRYYVVCGVDESWRMDNWRHVVLSINRMDYSGAHYWRTSGGDFWLLSDAVAWARDEAKELLARRQEARS